MDVYPGMIIASRYKVLRELGRGGMGAVYLVEHVNTGDHAALKVMLGTGHIDPEALERFKREARAPAKIKSEHVVKVLDADSAPELAGAPFLVMELLQGTDLQKLVRERGRLPMNEVVELLQQASIALDKSHALGIVHRDLKPENLYLHTRENGSRCVKLLDFGISKVLPQASASAMPMTSLGAVMGTPLFMSPEQARGAVTMIGPQTDVWAIGLIVVHLLTGEHYWTGMRTLADLMTKIIRVETYPPTSRWPWLPPSFDAWFARSCAADPAQRFSTVGEQVAALGQALGVASGLEATAYAPSSLPPSRPITPAITPMITPPYAAPIVGASTTARGAVSGPVSYATPSRGPSAAAVLAVGLSVFAIVGGVGTAAVLWPREAPKAASAHPPAPTTAVASEEPVAQPLPTLQAHASTAPAAHVPPRPSSKPAAPTSASAPPSVPSAPPKSKHQQCVDDCVAGCKTADDPFDCAKPCVVDCP